MGHTSFPMLKIHEAPSGGGTDEGGTALSEKDIGMNTHHQKECDRIREKLKNMFLGAIRSDGIILNAKVMELSLRDLQNENMRKHGAKDYKTQHEWLQQYEKKYVPKTLREAEKFKKQLQEAITQAKAIGGLTEKNIQHMHEALRRHSGDWVKVMRFFQSPDTSGDTLYAWQSNWKLVAEKHKHLKKEMRRLKLSGKELPGLAKLESDAFKSGKVGARLEMLQAALAELVEHEYGQKFIYAHARKLLEHGAAKKGIAHKYIDAKLVSIFSKHKGKAAEEFVLNALPGQIDDWVKASEEYADLKAKAGKAGVTIIDENRFLDLSYGPRRAKLVEINNVLRSREREDAPASPVLALIQRRMDASDWKTARVMLTRAENMPLSRLDRRRLSGLRFQCDTGEKRSAKGKEKIRQKTSEEEMNEACDELMISLMVFGTSSVVNLVLKIIQEGGPMELQRLFVLSKGIRNIEWGVNHNLIDAQKYNKLNERKDEDTANIQKHGHRSRGAENIDISAKKNGGSKEGVIRPYEEGHRGVTFNWFGNNSDDREEMVKDMDKRGSTAGLTENQHNYWTDYCPEDARLSQVMNMCLFVMPKIKKYCLAKKKVLAQSSGTQVVKAQPQAYRKAG